MSDNVAVSPSRRRNGAAAVVEVDMQDGLEPAFLDGLRQAAKRLTCHGRRGQAVRSRDDLPMAW